MDSSSKNDELMRRHYPININININSTKKEGDIFQRNSATTSTKTLNNRTYNITKSNNII